MTDLITTAAAKYYSQSASGQKSGLGSKTSLFGSIWFAFVFWAVAGAVMVLRFKALGIFGTVLMLFVLIIDQCARG